MSKHAWILPWLLAASAAGQDLGEDEIEPPQPLPDSVRELERRIAELEAGRPAQELAASPIDLSGDELPSIEAAHHDHVLARPWFENVELGGYGAFTYLDTGGVGTAENGSFLVKEASLFVRAEVWERTFFSSETWMTRFPASSGFTVAELNLTFTDLFAKDGERGVGLKAGRFEIPFGEEYLRWDANETEFITFSAADPYGIDEGVELYGDLGEAHWIAAVTNGAGNNGADDSRSKLFAGKLYGAPRSDVYLSGSVLSNDDTGQSALRLSGHALAPVGTSGPSSAGSSPSRAVDATCWEVDCLLGGSRRASVDLQIGQAAIDDDVSAFDRDLSWWHVLPRVRLNDELTLLVRYSEIGTYDSDEGYLFSGKPIAKGEDLGYDTSVLRRLSGGLSWSVNPHVTAKFEIGRDSFDLIDVSPLDDEDDERLFFGFELVASY